jgi:hypothetical protein
VNRARLPDLLIVDVVVDGDGDGDVVGEPFVD